MLNWKIAALFPLAAALFMGCETTNRALPEIIENEVVVELRSNKPKTEFFVRESIDGLGDDAGWLSVGVGQKVTTTLRSATAYDLRAVRDGYRPKSRRLSRPDEKRYAFNFYEADRDLGRLREPTTVSPPIGTKPPIVHQPVVTKRRESSVNPAGPIVNRWAVVVGISEYAHADGETLTSLAFADKDALDFTRELFRKGWSRDNVRLLTNQRATKSKVEYDLKTWLRRAGPDDLILLFWSGHGWPDPQDNEKAYFACYNSKPSDPSSGIRMDDLRRWLEERNARNVIVIADTCHSGKVIRSGDARAIAVRPALDAMQRKQQIPKGWIFVASAESDRKAYEDKAWSNGALTHAILRALEGNQADGYQSSGPRDGRVSLGELKGFVTDRMRDESLNIIGARLDPLFYTTSGDPGIWDLSLNGQ